MVICLLNFTHDWCPYKTLLKVMTGINTDQIHTCHPHAHWKAFPTHCLTTLPLFVHCIITGCIPRVIQHYCFCAISE